MDYTINPHNGSTDGENINLELIERLTPIYKNKMLECVEHARFLISVYRYMNAHRPFKRRHVRLIGRNVQAVADLVFDIQDPSETIAIFNRLLTRTSRIICLYRMPVNFSNLAAKI